jgi:hypothetical protein
VYGDEDKCDLLNKYFSLISKLEEENVPLPDFDIKTNNVINEIVVTISEIVDILKIDIRLKYLFNKSHLSSSPYTISSKFSSFIEFLRGGIQLFPFFDLISIFIIFQYVFGLDEFSKRR